MTATDMSILKQLHFQRDLRAMVERHDQTVEHLHPRGRIFIRDLYISQDRFFEALTTCDEYPERIPAQEDAKLLQDILDHLQHLRDLVEMIEALDEEDEATIATLRRDYALNDQWLLPIRCTHFELLLDRLIEAHTTHAPLLKRYHIPPALSARTQELRAQLAQLTPRPPAAIRRAEHIEADILPLLHKLHALATGFRDAHPDLYQDLQALIQKHQLPSR
jgi:hypothetical protein